MKGAISKPPTGRTLLGKFPEGTPARARASLRRARTAAPADRPDGHPSDTPPRLSPPAARQGFLASSASSDTRSSSDRANTRFNTRLSI
jgi:hypothetical protein